MNYNLVFSLLTALVASFALFLPHSVLAAASFQLSPSSGSFTLDKPVTIDVLISAKDKPVNAVSGIVDYPRDKLKLKSVSKDNSVVSLWPTEPVIDSKKGTLTFEGIIVSPGYQGGKGQILKLNFTPLKTGTAELKFIDPLVLANDDKSTPVGGRHGKAKFTLKPKLKAPAKKTPAKKTVPSKPKK